ncbi:Cholesterol desaturase daf-36 [Orchesella cincta]|uniref:cholesterol 7-desaturase n=1 Tax=Orchesella cincta TaxID=48709 RepID=A0A1D2M1J4_ORCCI|nr:Cholesterol desaturase daf-36 [Orchesella cincta]
MLVYKLIDLMIYFGITQKLGFEHVTGRHQFGNDLIKRQQINHMKRRKIGDLPPAYPNGWFAILESDELVTNTVKEIMLWMHIVPSWCPFGGGWNSASECIQCPFHGWKFDGCSGKLMRIPNIDSVPAAKLKMWTVHESSGFVYLWYHAEDEEPAWLPDICEEVEMGKWKYRGRSEFRVACHIQEIPENGPDSGHLNVVHSSLVTEGSVPMNRANWTPNTENGREHEALMLIGPGIVQMHFDTIFGKGILVQNVTPLGPMMQRVVHRFYSAPTFIHPLGLLVLQSEGVQGRKILNRKRFCEFHLLTKGKTANSAVSSWVANFHQKAAQDKTNWEADERKMATGTVET